MPIDASRAAFVKNEYRYETAEATAVKDTYKGAREYAFDTNLPGPVADALAATILNSYNVPAQAYEVEIDGVFTLADLAGFPPTFTCSFDQYQTDGRIFRLIGMDVDPVGERTVLKVSG